MEKRTYWLSFCDDERRKGDEFLGVAVIDVDEADTLDDTVLLKMAAHPNHSEDAPWIYAAVGKAWQAGCNPGGQVMLLLMPPDAPELVGTPRNQLLQKSDLRALGHIN